MLKGLALSPLLSETSSAASPNSSSFLEIKTWYLHNTPENQGPRLASYLEHGLAPAFERAGSKLAGAFGNLIGPDGPYYVTLVEHTSMAAMGECISKISADPEHSAALNQLSSSGSGLPFVRVNSSLLRSFEGMPHVVAPASPKSMLAGFSNSGLTNRRPLPP